MDLHSNTSGAKTPASSGQMPWLRVETEAQNTSLTTHSPPERKPAQCQSPFAALFRTPSPPGCTAEYITPRELLLRIHRHYDEKVRAAKKSRAHAQSSQPSKCDDRAAISQLACSPPPPPIAPIGMLGAVCGETVDRGFIAGYTGPGEVEVARKRPRSCLAADGTDALFARANGLGDCGVERCLKRRRLSRDRCAEGSVGTARRGGGTDAAGLQGEQVFGFGGDLKRGRRWHL